MAMFGTLLICERIYKTTENLTIIAGVLDTMNIGLADLSIPQVPLPQYYVYSRFSIEKLGDTLVHVSLQDEQREVWGNQILEFKNSVKIEKMAPAFEVIMPVPSVQVDRKILNLKEYIVGDHYYYLFRGTLSLFVDDSGPLAIAPLRIIFSKVESPPWMPENEPPNDSKDTGSGAI
jgi:hypothetical protein